MKSSIKVVSFSPVRLVLVLCSLPVAALPAQSADPSEWVDDVGSLLSSIQRIHPAPYQAHGAMEWTEAAADLERRLLNMNLPEAVGGFAKLIALLEPILVPAWVSTTVTGHRFERPSRNSAI